MSFLFALVKPLAYLSLPAIVLHTLSSQSPFVRYYVRLGLYLSTLGACSVWGVLVSVGMSLTGRRFDINYVVARSFYHLAGGLLNIRFEVEGEEHFDTRPAVLVGNHQSMLDILYLGRIFPKRAVIMAKKELQWMPLLGQYMSLSGAVYVDRGNNAKAVKSLADAGKTMKSRSTSLWLFPEGTRSMREHHDMLPFKKGAFHLAVQAGIPIIPVICENYWRIYRQGVLGSGTLKIKVLPPIPTTGLTEADIPDLVTRTRAQMVEALNEISIPAPASASAVAASSAPPTKTSSPSPDEPKIDIQEVRPEGQVVSPETPAEKEESPSRPSTATSTDNGAETEEDEGMVLVGRPKKT